MRDFLHGVWVVVMVIVCCSNDIWLLLTGFSSITLQPWPPIEFHNEN